MTVRLYVGSPLSLCAAPGWLPRFVRRKVAYKISARAYNFITNKITRSLNIIFFADKKYDVIFVFFFVSKKIMFKLLVILFVIRKVAMPRAFTVSF